MSLNSELVEGGDGEIVIEMQSFRTICHIVRKKTLSLHKFRCWYTRNYIRDENSSGSIELYRR